MDFDFIKNWINFINKGGITERMEEEKYKKKADSKRRLCKNFTPLLHSNMSRQEATSSHKMPVSINNCREHCSGNKTINACWIHFLFNDNKPYTYFLPLGYRKFQTFLSDKLLTKRPWLMNLRMAINKRRVKAFQVRYVVFGQSSKHFKKKN